MKDVTRLINIIIPIDKDINREIEGYFNKKKVKTKVIFLNKKK